jgi:hypothetical protein
MHITDEAPGFEKVSWMFKEVEWWLLCI